ncbi:MAG: methionine--tRNA ligase [Thermoplasmata archaeon]
MTRIFVGVAWPYANGPFHIGHLAGAYLPGDEFARYHRLRGHEVLMVSGSDMHGTPTLVRAEQEGTTPEVIANRYHAINRDAFGELGVEFDLYTTTHTVVHERTVKEVFLALLEHGFIRRRTEENAFCPQHQRFLPDRYLTGTCPHCRSPTARGDECDNCGRVLTPRELGDPKCSIDGASAIFRPSEHFYLELDKLAPQIAEYVARQEHWRPSVRGTARNFIEAGLRPTPITRDLTWGVPIPLDGYDSKRFYVWFEALIGYLSASREWAIRAGREAAWKRYWDPAERVHQYYFVGKDNIFHHTIILPGILFGTGGLQVPYDVPANEWLKIQGGKISKSRTEDAEAFIPALLTRYAPDVIRFYATLLAPQNHDTNFDRKELEQLSEEILSNQYGNLAQRILVLTRDREHGRVPVPPDGWDPQRADGVGGRIQAQHARITSEYEAVHLKEALDLALGEIREANRRIHDARPWQSPELTRQETLYEGLWLLKSVALWLAPILPFSSAALWKMLGYATPPSAGDWDQALVPPTPGQELGSIQPLFPRREPPARSSATPTANPTSPVKSAPLAIRAGQILRAEPHPSADKLYILTVDLGEPRPRTIVAGIRPFFAAEELTGRRVVILANLAPRTIRRITSQGMLLAADSGDRVVLLEPPASAINGQLVQGSLEASPIISYEQFDASPLLVGEVKSNADPRRSIVDVGDRAVSVSGEWRVGTRVVVRNHPDASEGDELLSFGPDLPLLVPAGPAPGVRVR